MGPEDPPESWAYLEPGARLGRTAPSAPTDHPPHKLVLQAPKVQQVVQGELEMLALDQEATGALQVWP